ncbi:MAG TPA: hypothetical protein P5040_05365 [Smithella sp.]|nr:hypothetical protein [Smithella sp.]HRS97594.1 hypothetical protein [Smithella sp.]
MKRMMNLLVVLSFVGTVVFGFPSTGCTLSPQPEPPGGKAQVVAPPDESYFGTIVKIEGNRITVRNDKGIEKIVTGKFTGLKVGSRVRVTTKNGLTWLNPQPEPPLPAKAKPLNQ